MKKSFIGIISLILVIACFAGCGSKKAVDIDILDITESTFLSQITEIYNDPSSYIGKTIKIEGIFKEDKHNGHSHYYVYRNAPVYDPDHGHEHIQQIGFEFEYNKSLPKENDWIEVLGILRIYTENGNAVLRLEDNNIKILNVRGAETIGDIEAVHNH